MQSFVHCQFPGVRSVVTSVLSVGFVLWAACGLPVFAQAPKVPLPAAHFAGGPSAKAASDKAASAKSARKSLTPGKKVKSAPAASSAQVTASLVEGAAAVGRFAPLPVSLQPHTIPRMQVLGAPLTFFDPNGKKWTAPVGTITDGASIPEMFKPIIGPSDDKRYLNAAIVHDAFCAQANRKGPVYKSEPSVLIHRMFYDACIAGGTDVVTAELMYAAVMIGGGYWTLKDFFFRDKLYRVYQKSSGELQPAVVQPAGRTRQLLEEKETPSDSLQLQQFRAIAKSIREKKPSIDELEAWLLIVDKQLDRGNVLARPDSLTR